MSRISTQFDLFDDDATGFRQTPRPRPRKGGPSTSRQRDESWDAEAAANRLEDTGDYRVLRRLVPRPIVARVDSPFPYLAVLVDTETTGLQHAKDEVIEIGAVAFTHDSDGRIGNVVGVYSGFASPQRRSRPKSPV